jgi:tetratricopeptide (TPR) repeat protein
MTGSDPEIQLPITLALDNHSGPATRIPQERLESMVAAALVEYDKLHVPQAEQSAATPLSSKSIKPSTWLVAAGGALAIIGSVMTARYFLAAPEPKPMPSPVQQVAPAAPPPAAAVVTPEPEAVEPSVAAPDDHDTTDKGRRALARSAPEDLLQKANQLRAAGRFRDAAQTYSLVYDRFPKSQAAYVARVAAGSLELEHLSNPLKARKLFESALQDRPKGALDLEARQGLSVALRDLEDRASEREVLRALVKGHPGSPAARRAQVRLMELGGE